ncbi:50S ribosomal protein L32e [Candidatus Pacearchaeota archaeon]|nr:50S ribosomal protein L32e [Candidatus Pacearchaeota archaeon]
MENKNKKRKKFIRRNWDKYSRLGWGRKKKQKWRKPRGRHAKMRERRKGYPSRPEIGMKSPSKEIRLVSNLKELLQAEKGEEVIVRKIGKKKRIEIEKKASELGVKILNLRGKK